MKNEKGRLTLEYTEQVGSANGRISSLLYKPIIISLVAFVIINRLSMSLVVAIPW